MGAGKTQTLARVRGHAWWAASGEAVERAGAAEPSLQVELQLELGVRLLVRLEFADAGDDVGEVRLVGRRARRAAAARAAAAPAAGERGVEPGVGERGGLPPPAAYSPGGTAAAGRSVVRGSGSPRERFFCFAFLLLRSRRRDYTCRSHIFRCVRSVRSRTELYPSPLSPLPSLSPISPLHYFLVVLSPSHSV